jgi:hypothetical protein
MAHNSGVRRVTEALADATGRSDDEVRLAVTMAVAGAGLHASVRILELLGSLGVGALKYAAPR